MKETNNCIVITGKSHCSRWLYSLNDNISNLIFVEPEDKVRISSLIDSVDVDVVLVHLQSQDKDSETEPAGNHHQSLNTDLAVIEELLASKPSLVVIALVETINQNLVLSIIRSGARDIIKIGTLAHEAQAIINRHQKRTSGVEAAAQEKSGYISALLNARVADGNALFAIHMALEMQRHGQTLLLDIGAPNADVMLMMGLTAKFSLIDVILNRTRLDATLIETGFARHSSGLSVLSMPEEDKSYAELTPADLHLILHSLKRHFKYIFINLSGITHPELLRVVLSLTSSSFLLMEQTIPSCKRNHDLVETLRQLKITTPSLRIIIDRHLSQASPSASSIAKSFEIPLAGVLPAVGPLRIACMNTGESIFEQAPASSYAKAIQQAARYIPGIKGDERQQPLTNFFGRLGNLLLRLKSR
jgi:pilus assembly protein CpaE